MLLLRSIFFTFLVPGSVTVLIPYLILRAKRAGPPLGAIHYLGWPVIMIGACGLLWCIWQFLSEGRGTLAPIDPPKHLVVKGLYRYVRNPMYVSVASILLGEAIVFWSFEILTEVVTVFVITHLFIVFYEEPFLKRQFGETYEKYLPTVGRWIPSRP
jgi:protein-S-isoprenylcysteine O-methyltransferase Ste14